MEILQIEKITCDELVQALRNEIFNGLAEYLKSDTSRFTLITRKQLKDTYGFSYSTISRYVSKGLLVPKRIGGKIFFDKHQIESVISSKISKHGVLA